MRAGLLHSFHEETSFVNSSSFVNMIHATILTEYTITITDYMFVCLIMEIY